MGSQPGASPPRAPSCIPSPPPAPEATAGTTSNPPDLSSPQPSPPPHNKPAWPGTPAADCARMLDRALDRDPTVKFMVQRMAEAGCTIGRSFFRVETCAEDVGGGFRPPDGVILCHNHLPSQGDVNHALVHELVHAYDHCRAATLDWSACEHHACSEIRAATLSGDCTWRQEAARGNWALRAGAQECARRRAALSVAMNPHCGGAGVARKAVDAVFEKCFADTAPFDRIP